MLHVTCTSQAKLEEDIAHRSTIPAEQRTSPLHESVRLVLFDFQIASWRKAAASLSLHSSTLTGMALFPTPVMGDPSILARFYQARLQRIAQLPNRLHQTMP